MQTIEKSVGLPFSSAFPMLNIGFPTSAIYPTVGCKGSQTSLEIRKGQAVNRLEQFLPPLECNQLQNLFLFIGLAENCIRQRR